MTTYISDNNFHTIDVRSINESIESLRTDKAWFLDLDVHMDEGVTYDTLQKINQWGATVLVDGEGEQSLSSHQFQLFLSVDGQCLLFNDRGYDNPIRNIDDAEGRCISPIRDFKVRLYYGGKSLYVTVYGYDKEGNELIVGENNDFKFSDCISQPITKLSYQLPEGITISSIIIYAEYIDKTDSLDDNGSTTRIETGTTSSINPITIDPDGALALPISDRLPLHKNDYRPVLDYDVVDYIPSKFLTGETINKLTNANYKEVIWQGLDNTAAIGLINSWNISGHAGKIHAYVPLKDLLVYYNGKVVKLSTIKDPGIVKYVKGNGWVYIKSTTPQYVEKNSMQVCGGIHQSTLDYRRSMVTTITNFKNMYKPKNTFGKKNNVWTRKTGSNLANFDYIAGQVHRGTSYDIYQVTSTGLVYVDTVEKLNMIFKNN